MLFALAIILSNAEVLTMSPAQPTATHVAVVDDKIVYVGDSFPQARKAAGSEAQVIDLKGKTLLPGFNDAHVHFGLSLTLGSERGVEVQDKDKAAWLRTLKRESAARPDNGWLFVTSTVLPAGMKSGKQLDFLNRPVMVVSSRGGLINKKGLETAGLGSDEIEDGFIRGRSLAAALDRVVKALPQKAVLDGARGFLKKLASLGITSVQLIDELPEIFEQLRKSGELSARVRFIPIGFRFDDWLYQPSFVGEAPDWVRVDAVKYFHDSGARVSRYELRELFDRTVSSEGDKPGLKVAFHVLSASALGNLLDLLESLAKQRKLQAPLGRWFRLEHVDEADAQLAARIAKNGLVVCSNPAMLPEWHSDRAFPMRTLLDAKVRSCIGTDWVGRHTPERPLSPLASLALAVTHGGYGERERISAAEALDAYTVGSATAEGMEDKKGSLSVGHFADLTVLSKNPTKVPPEELGAIEVLLTLVGGRVVHRAGDFAEPIVQRPTPSIGPAKARPPGIGPARPKDKKKR